MATVLQNVLKVKGERLSEDFLMKSGNLQILNTESLAHGSSQGAVLRITK